MPKIIENLRSRLIAEARRQVEQDGYSAMTIRSVATGCGVGVGTVYNYFSSKDELTAAFMLEDWQKCIDTICTVSAYAETAKPVIRCICDQLQSYCRQNQGIFRDTAAVTGFAGSIGKYHRVLRSQIAEPLRKFCKDDFTAEFVAEALLTWTVAGKEFQQIYDVIEKLLKE